MNDQIIAHLLKYQEMRKLKNEYTKSFNRHTLNKVLKLELELDAEAAQILAALLLADKINE